MDPLLKRFNAALRIENPQKRQLALETLRGEVFADYRSDAARILLGRNDDGWLPIAIAQTRRIVSQQKLSHDWRVTSPRQDAEPRRLLQDSRHFVNPPGWDEFWDKLSRYERDDASDAATPGERQAARRAKELTYSEWHH